MIQDFRITGQNEILTVVVYLYGPNKITENAIFTLRILAEMCGVSED